MLSNTAEYALRAVLHIAGHEAGTVPVAEIAASLDLPRNYLAKILHELVGAGVLESSRGKHGGFRLARPAETISLLDVVTRFDRISDRRECLLGRSTCSDRTACVVHHRWKDVSQQLADFFGTTTLADLMQGTPRTLAGAVPGRS